MQYPILTLPTVYCAFYLFGYVKISQVSDKPRDECENFVSIPVHTRTTLCTFLVAGLLGLLTAGPLLPLLLLLLGQCMDKTYFVPKRHFYILQFSKISEEMDYFLITISLFSHYLSLFNHYILLFSYYFSLFSHYFYFVVTINDF